MKFSMLTALPFFLLLSCTRVEIPDEISTVLSQSGTNRSELISTIARFQEDNDSLRLECLYYLLENSQYHNYAVIALYDSNRVEIDFSALDYDNYDQIRSSLDSLEAELGDLSWGLQTRKNDPECLNTEFLIQNIDFALSAWQNYTWSQDYSYKLFLEYILPYRGSSEPLESWRPYFQEALAAKIDSLQGVTDPLQIAVVANRWLKGIFKFDPRFYCHPTDQGLTEMLFNQSGRCEDMTNLAIYTLRSLGIAVTSDYTPYWANSDNNHAWNALITPAGEAIPFMGAEAEPGLYRLGGKLAKVYRKTFSAQPGNLAFRINSDYKVPAWLSGKNYLDVTAFYTDVSDVILTLEPSRIDSAKFAYLCVFNGGEWQPIHWGEIIDNQVTFSAMGTGICY
ncbi:MAG: transglutaminase domain-containing protein, partial [Candidatus Cloacimonetes bacterium]|nr:transglutaminase domain-containing protein [Candidatus Cloacimonadota bacterium]